MYSAKRDTRRLTQLSRGGSAGLQTMADSNNPDSNSRQPAGVRISVQPGPPAVPHNPPPVYRPTVTRGAAPPVYRANAAPPPANSPVIQPSAAPPYVGTPSAPGASVVNVEITGAPSRVTVSVDWNPAEAAPVEPAPAPRAPAKPEPLAGLDVYLVGVASLPRGLAITLEVGEEEIEETS